LLLETRDNSPGKHDCHVFKTQLWRSALKLDTDEMLRPVHVQSSAAVDFGDHF
jgi:hypothetical protein